MIFDIVPSRSFPRCRRALARGGTYVTSLPGEELAAMVEAGTLRPVVGEVFPLDAIREAHRRMQSGHARGKIVVRP